MKLQTRALTLAAVIAALYIVLTLPFAQIAFGPVQFRLAEAMTVLPILTPAAIPGLFIGCFVANLLNPQNLGIVDIVGGSTVTLLAAWLTWKMGKRFRNCKLAGRSPIWRDRIIPLVPPVILNGVIVGTYLSFCSLTPDQHHLISRVFSH